jgi:cytochrome c-type biogenesis protein CcmH
MRYRAYTPSIMAALVLVVVFWAATGSAWAIQPDEMLSNSGLETRARSIGRELRCLVCQNESIDDSGADLAHDLRVLVRQRLVAGDTDEQVKQYIVARYGTYVLLKPPFIAETYLLWFGPLILLLCAAGTVLVFYRSAAMAPELPPLSEAQYQRVSELIGHEDRKNRETE